jgi:hypothetical protein
MNANVKELWARTAIRLWPEELILASFNIADRRKIFGSEVLCGDGFCAVTGNGELHGGRSITPAARR